jgi:rubrerythrin
MYCSNCGTQVSQSTRFCPVCGSGINQASQSAPPPSNLLGFSSRINDPAFAKYIKNSNRYSAIFSIILAVAAVIGFYIAGEAGAEGMSNPGSLFIGLAIGGMFVVIALFQIRGRKRSATWDGTVEDKTVKKKTHHDEYSVNEYLEYSVIVRSDHGKKHVIKTRSNDIYNYYRVGDRVRYHAGLRSLEKYDKTGDKFIPCNACGTLCDISENTCFRCKCPLLK